QIAGLPGVTPAVATAAMAMVTLRREAQVELMAFADVPRKVGISGRSRLDDVCKQFAAFSFGGTDCSLPMRWALEQNIAADAFADDRDVVVEIVQCCAVEEHSWRFPRKAGVRARDLIGAHRTDVTDALCEDDIGTKTVEKGLVHPIQAFTLRRGGRDELVDLALR
ncbi:MAG: hypothetical protein HC841_09015, partial [Verrucomicrobiae bacterium]|nr:hypothetical protein [Verrucomicrobiae bacterium]